MNQRAEKRNKSDLLVEHILSLIVNSELKAGDKLPPEEELARSAGVSRVSVREALRGLKFLGLLRSSTRGGTVIQKVDFAMLSRLLKFQIASGGISLKALCEARLSIELGCLDMICGKLSEEQLDELRRLGNCTLKDGSRDDVMRLNLQDQAFHDQLLKNCNNPIMQAYSDLLTIFFVSWRNNHLESCVYPLSASRCSYADQHLELVEALAQNNLEYARGLMRRHLAPYACYFQQEPPAADNKY